MNISLEGRHALVCGGSGGIGFAAAKELASLGAQVTLLARNAEKLSEAVSKLPAPVQGEHSFKVADFSNAQNVGQAATEVVADKGVDILINKHWRT